MCHDHRRKRLRRLSICSADDCALAQCRRLLASPLPATVYKSHAAWLIQPGFLQYRPHRPGYNLFSSLPPSLLSLSSLLVNRAAGLPGSTWWMEVIVGIDFFGGRPNRPGDE